MKSGADIAVVGAGIGGLSAAIHLAKAGAKVTVYEKNARVGGKMNIWEPNGFTFDTGPHVLTMLFALDELFRAVGSSIETELELVRLDPICRYHFPDGTSFDASGDVDTARSQISEFAPSDLSGFDRFLDYSRRVYDRTTPTFLCQDFNDRIELLKLPGQMRDFLALRPFETLKTCVDRYFTSPKLKQIFRLYALYSGSDPARCSSLLSVIAYVQWGLGTFYVRGGLYQLAEKLAKIAQTLGVKIVTDTPVSEIIVRGNRAVGLSVQAAIGAKYERIFADYVVCNRDALSASELIKGSKPAASWEPTPSAFIMLLGVDRTFESLAHHNSFLTSDEEGEYASLWSSATVPHPDPTVGVACQSVTDPSKAPPGCSNLFVMTNVPASSLAYSWSDHETARYRKIVLAKLESCGLKGLSSHIVTEQVWTPDTFRSVYCAWRGALYGPSGNGIRQMFTRPSMTDKAVRGLYYVGGSVHPGGGVPLCALSGKIVAEKIVKDSRR